MLTGTRLLEVVMTNYLFLRGNRNKRFFTDIAKELNKLGHKSFQLKFELGELLYNSGIQSVFVPFKVSKQTYPISDNELLKLQIYNVTYKKQILKQDTPASELHLYKRYMYYIDQFIEEHHIDVICFFNGYHWIDQITKVIADKRGLKTFYFEDGLFRPITITCDPKGINANSSVPSDPSFYDALTIDEKRLGNYLYKPETLHTKAMGENLMKVAAIKAISMLGSLFKIHPSLYSHITFWQAIKYFVHKKAFQKRKPDNIQLPVEYIFLPFQVSRDTQIFYNSPNISTMEELLDYTYNAVTSFNKKNKRNLKIIVKEHPEDMSRNNYKLLKERYKEKNEVLFVQKYDINNLINNALTVITINSTVGIEAITKFKPVISLGEALYNIDGIALNCKNPKKLEEYIHKAIHSNVNFVRIKKFIYYLRFQYQIEGSINIVDQQTAINVAKRINTNP
jgi:capsule polysaccharide modification protein KpsS